MRISLTRLKNGRDAAGRRGRGRRTGNKQSINGGLNEVEGGICGVLYIFVVEECRPLCIDTSRSQQALNNAKPSAHSVLDTNAHAWKLATPRVVAERTVISVSSPGKPRRALLRAPSSTLGV